MSSWENYGDVLSQMDAFGIALRSEKDLAAFPKQLGKRITCGAAGKDWYKLFNFTRDGRDYLTGTFGTYRHGGEWQKVEVIWAPLSEAERERQRSARQAQRDAAAAKAGEEAALAAASALDIWRKASIEGQSGYLERKGLQGEACRFLSEQIVMRWPGEQGEPDTVLRIEGGSLVLPLIRYDFPRHEALRALQFIRPDGTKLYMKGFEKPGCALRLGDIDDRTPLVLVCEGYATGLTIRQGIDLAYPVYVAWDAGNLGHVVSLLRGLYPEKRILICADDDWKTKDRQSGQLSNPGRRAAKKAARETPGCDLVAPVFDAKTRAEKDTDFDDLRQRQGLPTVRRQLAGLIQDLKRFYG